MLKNEIKYLPQTKKDIKKFGITVGIFLIVVSLIIWYFDYSSFIYFSLAGFFLLIAGIFFYRSLKRVYKVWMTIALILGWFMTRLILTIIFYFVVTPIGLLARVSGKRFLQLLYKEDKESYWQKRSLTKFSKEEYERQF